MGVSGLTHYMFAQAGYQQIELQQQRTDELEDTKFIFVLDELFRKEVERFLLVLKQHGVRIASAVFDGAFDASKDSTRKSRRTTRYCTIGPVLSTLAAAKEEKQRGIVTPASTLASLNGGIDSTSISPFRDVFIQLLKAENIEVIVAPFEGDNLTAAVCKQRPGSAILADDSDYFIMGVPLVTLSSLSYIPFNCIGLDEETQASTSSAPTTDDPTLTSPTTSLETSSSSNDLLRFHIYRPERVLEVLKIDPQHLSYLSVLAGNDYTEFDLTLRFARSAGFAGSASTAIQRVSKILAWLRKTKDVDSSLRKIFRRYKKGTTDYNTALTRTLRATTVPDSIDDALAPPTMPDGIHIEAFDMLWNWHKTGKISPLVMGVLLRKSYWNPIIPGSTSIYEALQPLRHTFFRALFSCFHGLVNTVRVAEGPSISLSHLLSCLSMDKGIHSIIQSTATQDPELAHILTALHYIQHNQDPNSKIFLDLHYKAILQQYLILNTQDWQDHISKMPRIILPEPTTVVASSVFVLVLSWIKLFNLLSGEPLGRMRDQHKLFDGFVFALWLSGAWNAVSTQVEIPTFAELAWRDLPS